MRFLEKDLERIIYETPKKKLRKKGLHVDGHILRQVSIPKYGIADLVTVKRIISPVHDPGYLHFTIYELKKDRIGISAFLQAIGYVKGIKEYLEKKRGWGRIVCDFTIVLIGSEIDKTGNFIFLTDCLGYESEFNPFSKISSVDFYTYSYDVDGISFKRHSNYHAI